MANKIIKAILWDGKKQINGQLHIEKYRIIFQLQDFAETDLDLDIAYRDIEKVEYHQLYNLTTQGLEINTKSHKKNIFIVEEPIEVKKVIEGRCKKQTF